MKPGSVVVVALPQSDGIRKPRPAVVIRKLPPFDDWLLCAVTSQLHNAVPGLDLLIDAAHPDYSTMSLKCPSVIRTGKLHAMPTKEIIAEIGAVSSATYSMLVHQLTAWLNDAP